MAAKHPILGVPTPPEQGSHTLWRSALVSLYQTVIACRSDSVAGEIALGGLEKEDKELHQLDFAVFSKVRCTCCMLTSCSCCTLISWYICALTVRHTMQVCMLTSFSGHFHDGVMLCVGLIQQQTWSYTLISTLLACVDVILCF